MSTCLSNIRISPVRVVTIVMLLLIPEVWLSLSHPWYEPIVSILFNTYNYLAIALLIAILSSCIRAVCGRVIAALVEGVFFLTALAYSVSQAFLWFNFYRHWDQFTIQLVKETTQREASEFISTYFTSSPATIYVIAAYALIVAVCFFLDRLISLVTLPHRRWQRALILIYITSVLAQVYFLVGSLDQNYERASGLPVKRTAAFNIRQSFLQVQVFQDELSRCAHTLQTYHYRDTIPSDTPDIVWIIGESYNRHHSALYGYDLMTTPNLSRRQAAGQLFCFDDVVAPYNGTSDCFKAFLSLATVSDSIAWYDAPLLPALFKAHGWNVVFYSNQFTTREDLRQWDASMGFLNYPKISSHLFTSRNFDTYAYDHELIDDYINHRSQLEADSHNFIIFHLYGQHVNFSSRYPASYNRFSASDIHRPDRTEEQKAIIAQYDNATLYNDAVVESIIKLFEDRDALIIYFADHGEEVYDFRDQLGRTSLDVDDPRARQPQLDIPFLVLPTARCLASHPDIASRLSLAIHRPFSTDSFPHLLLNILN